MRKPLSWMLLAVSQLLVIVPSVAGAQERVLVRVRAESVVVLPQPSNAATHWRSDERRRMGPGEERDPLRMPAAMRALAATHWHVPEFHDEQRFVVGTRFGPYVYLYASPWLDGFNRMSQFVEHGAAGILVGMLQVDAPSGTVLTGPYAGLQLSAGGNCVWLANVTGNETSGWRAFVSTEHPTLGCVRSTPRTPLTVYRTADPAFQFADFPAVARFSHATSGQPLIGVKCLDGWCELGPPGLTMEDEHPGLTTREGRIKGWSDNQVLGQVDAAGQVLPSAVRASIIPAPNVNRYSAAHFETSEPSTSYTTGWVRVASIVLTADPPPTSKYYRWGLRAGTNAVSLRRASGVWQARVTPPSGAGGVTHYVWENVHREQHFDATIPATARWRVAFFDDPIWVPCGQACCSVDGGTY